jgi:hypothetical protein
MAEYSFGYEGEVEVTIEGEVHRSSAKGCERMFQARRLGKNAFG